MSTALATIENQQVISREQSLSVVPSVSFEDLQIALAGDLSRLTAEGRVRFYTQLCEFTGINPLAKPFDWLTFQGKLTLYPNKGCAEQLRKLHKVTFDQNPERKLEFGCLIMTVRCSEKTGRNDFATAALPFDERMQPSDKANAIMKLETKAKRRATLSICGLTMFARDIPDDMESPDEATRAKLKPLSDTESASERASALTGVIDTETISQAAAEPQNPAGTSTPHNADNPQNTAASSLQTEPETDPAPFETLPQPTELFSAGSVESVAAGPHSTKGQTSAPEDPVGSKTTAPGSTLSPEREAIVRLSIENIVAARGIPFRNDCIGYLQSLPSSGLPAGSLNLSLLSPAAAAFIQHQTATFYRKVEQWKVKTLTAKK